MYIERSVRVFLSETWKKLAEFAMRMNTVYAETKAIDKADK